MHVDGYVQALREDLARVAAVGDESTLRAAELLAVALESALGRRMQEALAEAALELSGQLPEGHVEVRIAGGDPDLVYVNDAPPTPPTASEPADPADDGPDARVTLRLPERLKSRLEEAAGNAGVSVNTWLVQMLSRSLEPHPPTHGGSGRHRLSGYGRA
jgi:hypothetical protein